MVRLQEMITKWKRRRLVNQIIASGEKLRRLQVARAELYPDDPELSWFDHAIDQRERQHDKLIARFKETN